MDSEYALIIPDYTENCNLPFPYFREQTCPAARSHRPDQRSLPNPSPYITRIAAETLAVCRNRVK